LGRCFNVGGNELLNLMAVLMGLLEEAGDDAVEP
jgi:hypothetical protein